MFLVAGYVSVSRVLRDVLIGRFARVRSAAVLRVTSSGEFRP